MAETAPYQPPRPAAGLVEKLHRDVVDMQATVREIVENTGGSPAGSEAMALIEAAVVAVDRHMASRVAPAGGQAPQPMAKSEPVMLIVKSHVSGYQRRDGTVVKEHDDGRAAAKPEEHHGRQAEMHGHLEKHGWRRATEADEKTHTAYASKMGEKRRLEAAYASGEFRRPAGREKGETKHYVHPDKPHEVIETSPAEKTKAGSDYNVWTHHKAVPAGKPGQGPMGGQFMGGSVGKSGKVDELHGHLASGKSPS